MISEPELAGEFDAIETREIVGGIDREPTEARQPWMWALGGALAASVLWAAAVFQFGLGDMRPDARGYRITKDSCRSVRLTSLGASIAPRDPANVIDSGLLAHPALDQIQCSIPLRLEADAKKQEESGRFTNYTVHVTVALHSKDDPGAEFEALRRVTGMGVVSESNVKTVPYLGDRAYMIARGADSTELRVLDGAAVLTLALSVITYYASGAADDIDDRPDDTLDLSSYQAAMINDMRDVMSSLKQ
ncbi:hypothetical protein [Streptomyces fructofermentans]|uniref:Uncharacterized protein n=1 Tax=Streptomyces fructofermentans TaxID=152141 RepID=A0A918U2L2_9ACTN|nr:hypothetical protein [Streptomyces fructofermentans]GGX82820.1 hypothetical protein GCM10010515_58040 [Streptomyces fructofermentans]